MTNNRKVVYMVTDPDGDRMVFDTEIAAKKFVIKQVKKYDVLDDEYIDHVKTLMAEEPNTAPPAYYTFINEMLQTDDDMENFNYYIESLDVMTEEDV